MGVESSLNSPSAIDHVFFFGNRPVFLECRIDLPVGCRVHDHGLDTSAIDLLGFGGGGREGACEVSDRYPTGG